MREKIRRIRINSNPDPATGLSRLFDKNITITGEDPPNLLIGVTEAFIPFQLKKMAEKMEEWADRKKKNQANHTRMEAVAEPRLSSIRFLDLPF
ncbi:hypothetical protein AAC387_Pa02g0212 [Persea americana]